MNSLKYFVICTLIASCGTNFQGMSVFPDALTITPNLIQSTLDRAKVVYPQNRSLQQASVAQVVFPKIFKAGLVLGGTYGEGFLVRDGIPLARVRLAGGNAGLTAGAQSFSQIVYILDETTLANFRGGTQFTLDGTLNYADKGQSISSKFGKVSPTKALYTTIFNQSGYLTGITVDGTIMQIIN